MASFVVNSGTVFYDGRLLYARTSPYTVVDNYSNYQQSLVDVAAGKITIDDAFTHTTNDDDVIVDNTTLNEVNDDVDSVLLIVDEIKDNTESIETKIDTIDGNVDSILSGTGTIYNDLVVVDTNVDSVLSTVNTIDTNVDTALTNIATVDTVVDNIYSMVHVIEDHIHPHESACAPDMLSRRGAIQFTVIAANNTVSIDGITYTFVSALGSPTANNVHLKLQGTLRDNVKLIASATKGVTDAVNIAYGTGSNPNPNCIAYWTSQRFSVGTTTVTTGENLFILERPDDLVSALTLSTTATASVTAFTRAAGLRYTLNGNTSPATNSIRGALHCLFPIGSIVAGGQGGALIQATYDVHEMVLCDQSDTSEKEIDFYISNDEVTFTRVVRSVPFGDPSSSTAIHNHIMIKADRVPAGYGYYMKAGSNGTSSSATVDLKFLYHVYND